MGAPVGRVGLVRHSLVRVRVSPNPNPNPNPNQVRQSVVLGLSAVHGTSLLAVINAVLRMTRTTSVHHPASGTSAADAAPNGAGAAAAAAGGGYEGGGASKASPGVTSHLPDLTRLMSMLSHHVAMPDVLLSCPEMLPHLLDFMQQESAAVVTIVSTAAAGECGRRNHSKYCHSKVSGE